MSRSRWEALPRPLPPNRPSRSLSRRRHSGYLLCPAACLRRPRQLRGPAYHRPANNPGRQHRLERSSPSKALRGRPRRSPRRQQRRPRQAGRRLPRHRPRPSRLRRLRELRNRLPPRPQHRRGRLHPRLPHQPRGHPPPLPRLPRLPHLVHRVSRPLLGRRQRHRELQLLSSRPRPALRFLPRLRLFRQPGSPARRELRRRSCCRQLERRPRHRHRPRARQRRRRRRVDQSPPRQQARQKCRRRW